MSKNIHYQKTEKSKEEPEQQVRDGMTDDGKVQRLEEELKALRQQVDEMRNKYMRTVADYQNLEKRQEREKVEWAKYANAPLLLRILEVADNLDRAANFIKDAGLEMVRGSLTTILREFGVEEIDVLGKEFDLMTMEAVDKREGKENHVVDVVQKGYKLHDRVLRHAKVVVGS